MKFIFAVVVMMMADRALPANVRRFGGKFFEATPEDLWRRYGWVSFPRTLFAVGACLAMAINWLFPIDNTEQGFIAIIFVTLWGVSASIDVFNARR